MDDFRNRVAVVTGGGSGIGAALARAFAHEGMSVVLADLDEAGMRSVAAEIESAGGRALSVRTDVSRREDVRALADRARERFGAVHVVCNNAGVGVYGELATTSPKDWKWVMDVNFWGVVHGVETFVPILLEQGQGGHVVNTASMAGLVGMAGLGVYCASKFAVVGLSESLFRELQPKGIGVSVLCPMIVRTQIGASERNRPAELRAEGSREIPLSEMQATSERVIEPADVADRVLRAIRERSLYVLTHRESREILAKRAARIDRAAERFGTA